MRLLCDGECRPLCAFLYLAPLQLFDASGLSLCSRSFPSLLCLFSLSKQLDFPFSSLHDLRGWCSIVWFVSSFLFNRLCWLPWRSSMCRGVKQMRPIRFLNSMAFLSKLPLMRSDFSPHLVRVADLWWLPRLLSHFMVCSIMFLGRSIAVW